MKGISANSYTDSGTHNNEDSFFLGAESISKKRKIFVAVIADGVGGLDNGDLASLYITKSVGNWFESIRPLLPDMDMEDMENEMLRVVKRIHKELLEISEERAIQCASTMTFAIVGKKNYIIVHVGDSRAYMYDGHDIFRLTEDQTVGEYERIHGIEIAAAKAFSQEKKERTLLQCMGQKKIEPIVYRGLLPEEFDLLLCSDGMTNLLQNKDIQEELEKNKDITETLKTMTRRARELGETDNITSILIRKKNMSV